METTINIKLDEKQIEDIVKKVTENIIKKANEDSITTLRVEEPKEKRSLMFLRTNVDGLDSEEKKVYFGYLYHTLANSFATKFDLDDDIDRKEVEKLKSQGWKEEVIYK